MQDQPGRQARCVKLSHYLKLGKVEKKLLRKDEQATPVEVEIERAYAPVWKPRYSAKRERFGSPSAKAEELYFSEGIIAGVSHLFVRRYPEPAAAIHRWLSFS